MEKPSFDDPGNPRGLDRHLIGKVKRIRAQPELLVNVRTSDSIRQHQTAAATEMPAAPGVAHWLLF
jgi:hypothetical protein